MTRNKENKEKPPDKTTNYEGYFTTYLHQLHPQEQNKNYNPLFISDKKVMTLQWVKTKQKNFLQEIN